MNEHALRITDNKIMYTNQGYVSYRCNNEIFFRIAKLTYELFDNESYQYIFEPYYDILDAFESLDIPGIDLSLREKVYYRSNLTPVFISERVTPKNRINLLEELKEYDMNYYQPFLLLMDSMKVYGGDKLSLKSDKFYNNIIDKTHETNDLYKTISYTLRKLAARVSFKIGNLEVNDHNRTNLIKNYLFLYEKVSVYYDQKSKGNIGRRKQSVSFVVLREIQKQYSNGLITIDDAVKRSGVGSKRTFYRRLKELNESELDS